MKSDFAQQPVSSSGATIFQYKLDTLSRSHADSEIADVDSPPTDGTSGDPSVVREHCRRRGATRRPMPRTLPMVERASTPRLDAGTRQMEAIRKNTRPSNGEQMQNSGMFGGDDLLLVARVLHLLPTWIALNDQQGVRSEEFNRIGWLWAEQIRPPRSEAAGSIGFLCAPGDSQVSSRWESGTTAQH